MNLPIRSRTSRSGFTLVELLVVIAIIAILAAVISVSAGAAINAAKRAKAANTATQLQTAVINYYTEYGVYPIPATATTDVLYNNTDQADWQPLCYALCGNINAYNPQTANNNGAVSNSRNIAFLTPKKSEVDANGIPFNPFTTASSPQYFNIAIDADYSGILGDSGAGTIPDFTQWKAGSTCSTYIKLTQGAAVWACCDPSYVTTPSGSTSPSLWVHTY